MRTWVLIGTTLIYALTVGAVVVLSSESNESSEAPDEDQTVDARRNESSTPRSFILPASPAVALQLEQSDVAARQTSCAHKLRTIGIDVVDDKSLLESIVVSKLREFQKARGLKVTGLLDQQTIEVLGC
jgi:hypothetical protein